MIAEFLHKNPRILLLTVAVIVVGGLSSFFVLPRLEDPVLGRRVGLINTVFPGANARRVESLVTIPLEQQLNGIAKIKQVRSNSQTGVSNIVVELKDEVRDVDPVWSTIRNRLAEVEDELPDSCYPPQLEVFPLKAYAAIIALQGKTDEPANLSMLRRLTRELQANLVVLPGTEQVDVFGDPEEEFAVEIQPTMLASLGMSVASLATQIEANQEDQPAGRLHSEDIGLPVDLATAAAPLDRIRDTVITYGPRRQTTPLDQIAAVSRRIRQPLETRALVDGQPALVLAAMVSDERRVDRWADRLDQTLAKFQQEYAQDVSVEMLFSQRQHVDQRMGILLQNLGIGTAAVMGVVLLLMGWQSMVVVGAALPLSALMVLMAMRAMEIPIHQMSITGLIVALGLLIDNAIVIVHDVRMRIVHGDTRLQAIAGGVRHLAMPLFGSTSTTAFAFLPIATLPGPPGEFVGSIAVSVILAISASFVLAMTVIPALVSGLRFQPVARGWLAGGISTPRLRAIFELTLRTVFRWPLVGLLLGVVLPIGGFLAARDLPEQFFPPSDRNQIQIEVEMPAAETLPNTERTVNSIREIVADDPQVARQYWFLGGSAPTFYYNVVPRRRGTPHYAQAFVDLTHGASMGSLVRRLQTNIDQQVPHARVIVRQLEQGPPFDAPVEVRVAGADLSTLQTLGSELRLLLSQTNNVIHTRSDMEQTIPRLSLAVDELAANAAGLDRSQLAGLLYTTLEGAVAGKVYADGEELPVRVRLATDQQQLNHVLALPLPSMKQVPPLASETMSRPPRGADTSSRFTTLADLAESQLDADVGAIVRIDGRRTNEVKAYLQAGVLPSVVIDEFQQRLAASAFQLPAGYSLHFGGETEKRTEAVDRLIANGLNLLVLILLTLVASFGSFRCAFIIACVGTLSAGLGPLTLLAFGYPFGFMAIVGTMGLVGVAINDSIVVLAAIRANTLARRGDLTALVTTVVECSRHVIATTLTTVVGFTPLILAGGGFWPPLAITIAGGVGGATFIALYVVPAMHLLVTKWPGAEQQELPPAAAASPPSPSSQHKIVPRRRTVGP